jgi:putative flippase GtrA
MAGVRGPLQRKLGGLASPGIKFIVVGGLATVTTIGVFNLLVHVGSPPILRSEPIPAYGIALVVGLAVNYAGNRFWVFEPAPGRPLRQELLAFLAVNAVAFAIPALCLAVSRHLMGLDSALADNVSANVIGLILATASRWWLYRNFVFAGSRSARRPAGEPHSSPGP